MKSKPLYLIAIAGVLTAFGTFLSAEEQASRPPRMGERMMSSEAKEKIDAKRKEIETIRKAEMEKNKAEREEIEKMIQEYKTTKNDEVKTRLTATIAARYDRELSEREARIAEMSKKLAEDKANKSKTIENILGKMLSDGQKPQRPGKGGPKHSEKKD